MAKGRYIKNAERACAAKARFETAQEAERASDYRFRAYRCPVCHHFHLTSRSGAATDPEPEPPKPPEPKGPKLADLDWSALLEPNKSKSARPAKPPKPKPPPPPPTRVARCLGPCGKDGRAPLLVEGRLVKSRKIADNRLKAALKKDLEVRIGMDDPPEVLAVLA